MTKLSANPKRSQKSPSPTRNSSGLERVTLATQAGPHFFVYCDSGMTEKWRNDKTIPLVDVLQSFELYEDDQSGGKHLHPSKDTLKHAFQSADPTTCIQVILERGRVDHHVPRSKVEEHLPRDRAGNKNAANRASAVAR